jgi:hypothetical protein
MTARDDCQHPAWIEEGDGHGHNYWRCAHCHITQWIAPWVLAAAHDDT